MESTAAVHLPRLLSALHRKYPALEVQLLTATSGALLALLRAGEISAAFVSGKVDDEPAFTADPAFVEELVLVTHPSIRRSPAATDLTGKTLVTFGAGCAYRSCIESWLTTKGVRPARTFEVASYHAMLACVAANVGYALAPRSVLLATTARSAVRAYRPNKLPWRMTTWLVRRATDRSRAVNALRALVVAGAGTAR